MIPLEDPVSTQLFVASGEVVNALPIPPIAYGIVTFVVLFSLFLVTVAFRSTGTRH